MRWLYLEYGVRPYPADGSGVVANYSPADGGDLQKIANDGSSVPRPGDVLSMEPTSQEGHTAVVTATNVSGGDGTISILEQNMNGGNGKNTLGVVGNIVQPDYGMPIAGWLQAPLSARSFTAGAPAADLVHDGGFNYGDGAGWRASVHSWLGIEPAGRLATRPYEGNGFGVTNTSVRGGGIFQDISFPVSTGDSFCADAEVVSAGARSGARGDMTIWLLGRTENQSSSAAFGPLEGKGQWAPVSTCITATGSHARIRIQFYDAPKTPTLGVDAVDVHQSFVADGGFSLGGGGWRTAAHSWFATEPAGKLATRPYDGDGFGVTNTSVLGGGIYQDIPLPVSPGDSFCADAEVVTPGARSGARADMTIWLLGETRRQSASVSFGPLPGKSQWTAVKTCVTATRSHSDLRIQFYDSPGTRTLGIGAVDVHQSFIANGSFNLGDADGWRTVAHSRFAIDPGGRLATRPYEGKALGLINASAHGGGIYQDISLPVSSGESFCADAEVVTAGAGSGARGSVTIFLFGDSPPQSSSVHFGPLPGRNRWTPVSTCVTATRPHSAIRVQFYDAPKTPTLGVDAVDVR